MYICTFKSVYIGIYSLDWQIMHKIWGISETYILRYFYWIKMFSIVKLNDPKQKTLLYINDVYNH